MVKDMQPLYTVEKCEFKVSILDPKYNIPSQKYFTSEELPLLYSEVREVVMLKYVK